MSPLLVRLRGVPSAAWTIVAGLFFISVGNYMIVPFFALYLTKELGLSVVDVSTALAVRLWTQRGLSIVGGMLADRWGTRNVMVLGLLLRFLGHLGLAYSREFDSVLLWTALLGVGASLFTPAGKAALVRCATLHDRLLVFSMRNTAINVGVAIGPPLGLLAGSYSYRVALLTAAALFVVFAILTLFVVDAGEAPDGVRKTDLRGLGLLAVDRRVIALAGVTVLFYALHAQLELTMPLFAGAQFSDTTAGLIFVVNAVTVVAFQLPLSARMERVGPELALSVGIATVGAGFLILAGSGGTPLFLTGVFVFTLGEIIVAPRLDDEVVRLAPPSTLGASFGLLTVAGAIGGSAGTYVGALLWMRAQQTRHENLVWLALGAFAITAATLVFTAIRRASKEPITVRVSDNAPSNDAAWPRPPQDGG
jgi:MFS transporter, DHA1 family, multidrug resistance protein